VAGKLGTIGARVPLNWVSLHVVSKTKTESPKPEVLTTPEVHCTGPKCISGVV
jgi:hypothetical protein